MYKLDASPILIVEDDPPTAEILKATLAARGWRVEVVASVARASERISKQKFAAIVLDYMLPDGDAHPILKLVRSLHRPPPVILITGLAHLSVIAETFRCGIGSFIVKNFNFHEIVADELVRLVTHAKATEEHYRLATLVRTSIDAFIGIDLNWRVFHWNLGAERMLGFSAEEMRGQLLDRLQPEDIPNQLREIQIDLAQGQAITELETVRLRKNGDKIWVSLTASPITDKASGLIGYGVLLRDISERKRLELQLLAERETLRAEKKYTSNIVEAAPALICGIALDGTTLFANRAVFEATGYTSEEITGKNWWQLFYPGEEYEQVKAFQVEAKKGPLTNYEMRLTTKTGAKRIVSWNSIHRLDDKGQTIELVSIGADVTEKRRMEDDLETTRSQLLQGQRLESLGKLAGGVAHDFNNLLAVILGNARLLQAGGLSEQETAKLAGDIAKAAARGADLTAQLLSFSRRDPTKVRSMMLGPLVEELLSVLAQSLEKSIVIKRPTNLDLWSIDGDSTQVFQVLMNLTVNSRDAMPEGGILSFTAENIHLSDAVAGKLGLAQGGQYVKVSVEDTGPGIAPAIRDKIFDPFFTTKDVGKGTGLGLSLAYNIMKSHNGLIHLDVTKTDGAKFDLFFPTSSQKAVGVGTKETLVDRADEKDLAGRTILLADDEALVRELMETVLIPLGAKLIIAHDGKEALRLYDRYHGDISCAVLDVGLPGMGGIEVFQKMREKSPDLRVLFCSGYADNAQVSELARQKDVYFLQKPFELDDFLSLLRAS